MLPCPLSSGGSTSTRADDARLDWTAAELKRLRVSHLVGAHCTGIEAVMHLRQGMGLNRGTAVVGAVGASFDLDTGIDPRPLAR
jgi:7,8-dihydropterin-6-yl-methyl-4-(beta-D-ribofuranosyl)aminobenzene 5'-phosphate synthase